MTGSDTRLACLRISARVVRPSITGIRISSNTTSGFDLLQTLQRFLAVVGKMDLVMGLLKYAGHQGPIGLVVIHHQQRGGREVIEVHRSARFGVISHRQPPRDGNIREAQVEDRALANFAFDGQAAAHQLGEALDDGQPDAGSFLFRRSQGVRLNKRFENFLQFLSRDPDAGVLDVDQQRPAAAVFLAFPGDAGFNADPAR